MMAVVPENAFEKVGVQVSGGPGAELGIGLEVVAVHHLSQVRCDIIAGQRFDADALFVHLLAFAADIAPLGGPENLQVIFKCAVSGIVPQIGLMVPRQE